MPLPSVTFRSELDPVVRKELDQLDGEITEYLLQEHDDDGKHTHITADSITVTGGTNLTSPVTIDGVPVTGAQPSASTFFYRADVTFQSAQDPGSGRLRWNTVNQHLATALYVDRLTDDGFDAMLFLELSHIADRFVLQDANLSASYQVWHLTGPAIDHVDWFELPVAFESSGGPGTFGQLDRIAMLLQTGGGGGVISAHHVTHETGGSDAIVSLSGAVITSGTVADARLSSNVPLKNAANLFTQTNTFHTVTTYVGDVTSQAAVRARSGDLYLRDADANGILLRNNGTFALHVVTGDAAAYSTIVVYQGIAAAGYRERGRTVPVGEWTAYTPIWGASVSAPSLGNGTITGRYTLIGKTCHYFIQLDFGSTSGAGNGTYTFSLPFQAFVTATTGAGELITGARTAVWTVFWSFGAPSLIAAIYGGPGTFVGHTSMAATHTLRISGTYEIA